MYWGTLKNHVVSALKNRLGVIVRAASMKKKIIIRKLTVFFLKSLYFLRHENFILRVFIFVHHNVLCLWWVARPIHRLLRWKGRVCEFLAILKGDRNANKMPMGDAKLKNVKWFYGQTCMIFKIIGPKGVQVSFHRLVGQTLHGFFIGLRTTNFTDAWKR